MISMDRPFVTLMRTLWVIAILPMVPGMTAPMGSGTAFLTGRSASGRTVLNAELQDVSGLFEGGSIIIDGHTLEFPADLDRVEHHAIREPKNGVFTLSYQRPGMEDLLFFRLRAIPSTFKIISGERNAGAVYTFDAVFEGIEPRPGKGHATPSITLNCQLEYRI